MKDHRPVAAARQAQGHARPGPRKPSSSTGDSATCCPVLSSGILTSLHPVRPRRLARNGLVGVAVPRNTKTATHPIGANSFSHAETGIKGMPRPTPLSANEVAPTGASRSPGPRPVSKDATADRAITIQFSIANGGRVARARLQGGRRLTWPGRVRSGPSRSARRQTSASPPPSWRVGGVAGFALQAVARRGQHHALLCRPARAAPRCRWRRPPAWACRRGR